MFAAFSWEFRKVDRIIWKRWKAALQIMFICLDAANVYFEEVLDLVKLMHAKFPKVKEHSDRKDGRWLYFLGFFFVIVVLFFFFFWVYFLKQRHTIYVEILGTVCPTHIRTWVDSCSVEQSDEICWVYLHSRGVYHLRPQPLQSMLQTFGSAADLAMSGGMFSSHKQHTREMRERNSHLKFFYGISFERTIRNMQKELLNSELQKITSKGSIENNILDVISLYKSSFLLPSHHWKGCGLWSYP